MSDFFQPIIQPPFANFFIVVFGLIWGSFFNVCIHRMPREEDVVFKPSHCPKCDDRFPWYLNIPVLSYLFLKGRCRKCKKRISIQYPLVEIASAMLFLWVFTNYGWSWKFLFYIAFHSSLLIITVIDIHHRIIPDELSLGGIVVGFLACFLLKDITWLESLGGILIGGGAFFLVAFSYEYFTKREGLGGGDIKLLGMIGAWLGIKSILPVIIISSALGSIVGIGYMVVKKGNMKLAIPFGPFLAIAAFIFAFWGAAIERLIFPSFQ